MKSTIERDGEDFVVVIPQEILDRAELKIGDEVSVKLESEYVLTIERQGNEGKSPK